MSVNRHPRPPRRRWWPYLLLVLVAGGLFALPYATERWVRSALAEHYPGRASLGEFTLQPWNGVVRVRDLAIGAAGAPLLVVQSLELDADLLPLLSGRLSLSRLTLEGLQVALQRDGEGRWRFDGRPVERMPVVALGLTAQTVSLGDLTLQLQGSRWAHEVVIQQAHVADLVTEGRISGDLIVDGRVDGAPVRLSARMARDASRADTAGRLDIDRLDLAALSHLGLTGTARLQGLVEAGFDLSLEAGGGIELAGRSQVTRGQLQRDGMRTGAGSLDWSGTLQLSRGDGWRIGLLGELTAGALQHANPDAAGADAAASLEAGGLSWKGTLEFDLDAGSTRIRQRGEGELTGLRQTGVAVGGRRAARIRWDGDLLLDRGATPGWRLRYDGTIRGERWQQGMTTLGSLTWDGSLRAGRRGDASPSGELEGKLELAANLTGEGWSLETGNTIWQGRGEWQGGTPAAPESTLRLDAELDGEGLAFRDDSRDLNARVSAFSLDGGPMTVTLGPDRTLLRQDAELSLGSSMVAGGFGQLMMHEGVLWEGPVALTVTPDEPFAADARGRLTSPAGELALADGGPTVRQARLDWDGLLHYQASSGVLSLDGGLQLIAPSVVGPASRGVLFDAIDLTVGQLAASLPGGIVAGGLVATTPRFSSTDVDRADAGVAVGDRLAVSSLEWQPGTLLRLGEVDVDGFRGRLVRESGGWGWPLPFASPTPGRASVWSLQRLTLAPGARLTYLDRAVPDGFQADLILERGELAGLDSGDPAAVGSATLEARQGDYTTLSLTGMLSASPETAGGVVHGRLRDVDLTLLSPFSTALFGHRIRYGQGDADLQWTLGAEGVTHQQSLLLRTLSVAPVAGPAADRVQERLGMPLSEALVRIRDDQGDVALELALDGGSAGYPDALLEALRPAAPPMTGLPVQ